VQLTFGMMLQVDPSFSDYEPLQDVMRIKDLTNNKNTRAMNLLFSGPFGQKTTQASFKLVAEKSQAHQIAFSVKDCADHQNDTRAESGDDGRKYGCFMRVNLTIVPDNWAGPEAMRLYGIPGGYMSHMVQLTEPVPPPQKYFSILNLSYWQSLGVVIGGTFFLIGLGSAGIHPPTLTLHCTLHFTFHVSFHPAHLHPLARPSSNVTLHPLARPSSNVTLRPLTHVSIALQGSSIGTSRTNCRSGTKHATPSYANNGFPTSLSTPNLR
jgi:hypothetical protein